MDGFCTFVLQVMGSWRRRYLDYQSAHRETGIILFQRRSGLALITGNRIVPVTLTCDQETRTIRLVADWIAEDLGLFPYLAAFCADDRSHRVRSGRWGLRVELLGALARSKTLSRRGSNDPSVVTAARWSAARVAYDVRVALRKAEQS
ncbi:MAG TPA: hypothetical protein VMK83_11890 [Gaiellaceae bacterium]|nr:hypothetical protein [Gaiellaceae bacterium]